MCGIVGILRTDGERANGAALTACLDAIAHRGPDGWGVEIRGRVGLGHRRLSIIDLEGGRQPMANAAGDIWVVFNGEIYNFRELRAELEARGCRFRSHSDTEVVIYAYQEWGEACVERFRGMFAFGILDERKQRIFLARDHLGIKPMYYLQAPGVFAFASELQALRKVPAAPLNLDLRAIDQYLQLQYIPAPRTAFKEIRKLPPAHRMTVALDGSTTGPGPYWDLEFRPRTGLSRADWTEALDHTLKESVRAHLVADVPFGAFLSGGVDSSGVVAYMAGLMDTPVRTFSIGFKEEAYNELAYAKQVADKWGTEHHVEIVEADALAVLPDLVRHYGEPFGDSSALPSYHVCRMARRHVPMVLSGDGGDESFAGYTSYFQWQDWLNGLPRESLSDKIRATRMWLRGDAPPIRRADLQGWLRFVGFMPVSFRRRLWRREHLSQVGLPVESLEAAFAKSQGYSRLRKAQYSDYKTYLPGDILTKMDIASMMHGLEVRTPMVDVKVAEFAATIPEDLLVRRDAGGWQGKLLLKQVLERYYPAEFINRPKKGFAVPLSKWFSKGSEHTEALRERLTGKDSALADLFRPESIAPLIGSEAHGLLWLLLFLDEWLRQNPNEVRRS